MLLGRTSIYHTGSALSRCKSKELPCYVSKQAKKKKTKSRNGKKRKQTNEKRCEAIIRSGDEELLKLKVKEMFSNCEQLDTIKCFFSSQHLSVQVKCVSNVLAPS